MADGRTVAVMNAANAGARMPRTTTTAERRCGRSSSADQEPGCTAPSLLEQAPDPAAEAPGDRELGDPFALLWLAAGPERLADGRIAVARAAAGVRVDRRHDDPRRRRKHGRGRTPQGRLHHVSPDRQRDVGAGEGDRTRVVGPDPDTDYQAGRVADEPCVPKAV